MLNYLARMPSPVAPFFFFSYVTGEGREAELVRQLEARPPTWVALLSRDLREYGIARYGESPGQGQLLMDWVTRNYAPVAQLGGDPLDVTQFGGTALHLKAAAGR
jgi:alpha-beta hydrolase superfamily lysophospholipase